MTEKTVVMVDIDDIRPDPDQPRKVFNEDDIASTAFTIESQGIINPIEVDENYMIVTGEIRWRSAKKAGLKQIPCVIWENGNHKRFERQVVENLHHHQLSDKERENAIVRLWETGEYPTHAQLAKSVGLSRSRITELLEAQRFRETSTMSSDDISTRVIIKTAGLNDKTREQILTAVAEDKIKASDIDEIRKIAKSSETLLEKTLKGTIDIDRAVEIAETMVEIEKKVDLTDVQKDRLVLKVEEDERILETYKEEVLDRVKRVMTAPKRDRPVDEPIGRESTVNKIITVKNEVLDNFRLYLGNCDMKERFWAKKIMIEIRDELNVLIEMIEDVQ